MFGDFPKTRTRAPSTISSCACGSTSRKIRRSRAIFSPFAAWATALSPSALANVGDARLERIFARGWQTISLRFYECQRAERRDRRKTNYNVARLDRWQLREKRGSNYEVKNQHRGSGTRPVAPCACRSEANVREIQEPKNRSHIELRRIRAPLFGDRPQLSGIAQHINARREPNYESALGRNHHERAKRMRGSPLACQRFEFTIERRRHFQIAVVNREKIRDAFAFGCGVECSLW